LVFIFEGPGCSSIGVGAFAEHGPFRPSDNNVLEKNDYSWNKGEPSTQHRLTNIQYALNEETKINYLFHPYHRGKCAIPGVTSWRWILLL